MLVLLWSLAELPDVNLSGFCRLVKLQVWRVMLVYKAIRMGWMDQQLAMRWGKTIVLAFFSWTHYSIHGRLRINFRFLKGYVLLRTSGETGKT